MLQLAILFISSTAALVFALFFFMVSENRRFGFMPDRTDRFPEDDGGDDDDEGGWTADWNGVEIDLPPGSGQPILREEVEEAECRNTPVIPV